MATGEQEEDGWVDVDDDDEELEKEEAEPEPQSETSDASVAVLGFFWKIKKNNLTNIFCSKINNFKKPNTAQSYCPPSTKNSTWTSSLIV